MMILRYAACLALCAVAAASARAETPARVFLADLQPQDRLEVHTSKYVLRCEIVDPVTGEALAALSPDGTRFGRVDRVFLLGSTLGRHEEGLMLVRMGEVRQGLRVELGVGTLEAKNRRLTEPVQAIRLVRGAAPLALRP